MARSKTIGAVRRTRRRICWQPCITAACCGWHGGRVACASTLRSGTEPSRPTQPNVLRGLTPLSTWPCESTHRCLSDLVRRLRFAVPQWRSELKNALQRVKQRLSHARVGGVDWYWPAGEDLARFAPPGTVRLLTPFDPVVWDRDRFELLWGWPYRFEAYTPAPKRKLGYYAMPLLWRDRVVGWANLSVENGRLKSEFGYVESRAPYDRSFKRELEAELDRMRFFLSIGRQTGI